MSSRKTVSDKRLWILTRLLGLPCLVIAATSLAVGAHDALLGVRSGQRWVGVFLTLCGAALLAALLLFLLKDLQRSSQGGGSYVVRERASVTPVLFLFGAVPGLLLVVVQVSSLLSRGFDLRLDWRLLIWLTAALVPLVTAALLWPIHRAERFTLVPRVLALLSTAGIIGAGQTFLTSYYAPVKRGDSLSVTTQLNRSELLPPTVAPGNGTMRSMQGLRGNVSLENSGDVRLVFLGGMYLVTGYNARPTGGDRRNVLEGIAKELAVHGKSPLGGVGAYEEEPRPSIVKAGIFFDPGSNWIAADTKVQLDFLAYAPKDSFERYVSSVILVAARADRLRLVPSEKFSFVPAPVDETGAQGIVAQIRIAETTWVNFLTRKSLRLFLTYRVSDRSPFPVVDACLGSKSSDCDRRTLSLRKRLHDFYGLNTFPAWVSLQMPRGSR